MRDAGARRRALAFARISIACDAHRTARTPGPQRRHDRGSPVTPVAGLPPGFEVKTSDGRSVRIDVEEDAHLAKPNFEFQKRQKELEKKRKKEEKKQKKLDRAAAQSSSPDTGTTPPEST